MNPEEIDRAWETLRTLKQLRAARRELMNAQAAENLNVEFVIPPACYDKSSAPHRGRRGLHWYLAGPDSGVGSTGVTEKEMAKHIRDLLLTRNAGLIQQAVNSLKQMDVEIDFEQTDHDIEENYEELTV